MAALPPILSQYNAANSVKKCVAPATYAINLMWLNKTHVDNQEYILPTSCRGAVSTALTCLAEVYAWKQSNPEATVNLWYDSEYTTVKAIQNTRNKLDSMGAKEIFLKDIREIPIVKNNPDSFSDNLPIYFRIDLMKFVICLWSIEGEHNECAIVTDFLVGTVLSAGSMKMTKEELFSPQTLEELNTYGLKVTKDLSGKIENQFFQAIRHPRILDALKLTINICLNTAVTTLKHNQVSQAHYPKIRLTSLSDFIYDSLFKPTFLNLCLTGINDLKVNNEIFDPARHGYDAFGNTVYGSKIGTAVIKEQTVDFSYPWKSNFSRLYNRISFNDEHMQVLVRHAHSNKEGDQHSCEYESLIQRAPADGSGQYKCVFIPMGENNKQLHNESNKSMKL